MTWWKKAGAGAVGFIENVFVWILATVLPDRGDDYEEDR